MATYVSKNSEYELKDGKLSRDYNGKIQNLGSKFVYISDEVLLKGLNTMKISISSLEKMVDPELQNLFKLLEPKMDLNQKGGRFFASVTTPKGNVPFYSGKILEIENYDSDAEVILEPAEDGDNKIPSQAELEADLKSLPKKP